MDFSKLFKGLSVAESFLEEGKLNPDVMLNAFFSGRFSDEDKYFNSLDSLIEMNQSDFSSLQEREVVHFNSGKNKLTGYLYKNKLERGFVLYVHGLKGMADDQYAMGIDAFLKRGYFVFAIDLTASGNSGGMKINGLQQSALDVASAVNYISTRNDLKNLPLFGFGHSWGAYGVAASLNFHSSFLAICVVSGFVSPIEEMIALPKSYAGEIVESTHEALEEAAKKRDPSYYNLSAEKGIRTTKTKTLIAHGCKDNVVPFDTSSAYHAFSLNPEKCVTLMPFNGVKHMDILFDSRSYQYREKVEEELKLLKKKFGKTIDKLPDEVLVNFTSSFSKPMCGIANSSLFDAADSFFASSIKPR